MEQMNIHETIDYEYLSNCVSMYSFENWIEEYVKTKIFEKYNVVPSIHEWQIIDSILCSLCHKYNEYQEAQFHNEISFSPFSSTWNKGKSGVWNSDSTNSVY